MGPRTEDEPVAIPDGRGGVAMPDVRDGATMPDGRGGVATPEREGAGARRRIAGMLDQVRFSADGQRGKWAYIYHEKRNCGSNMTL